MKEYVLWLAAVLLIILTNGCGQGGPANRSKAVEFGELVSNPQKYHGKDVCTEGVYVSAFEISALGASTYQRGSAVYLTEPAIWIGRGTSKSIRGNSAPGDGEQGTMAMDPSPPPAQTASRSPLPESQYQRSLSGRE